MWRVKWLKSGGVPVLICILGLSSAPLAKAAAVGDARWCAFLATPYDDATGKCKPFDTLQAAVNAAKADGFHLTSSSGLTAILTCSKAMSNPGNGIWADLGSETLFLKSVMASKNGVDTNLFSGTSTDVSAVSCPS